MTHHELQGADFAPLDDRKRLYNTATAWLAMHGHFFSQKIAGRIEDVPILPDEIPMTHEHGVSSEDIRLKTPLAAAKLAVLEQTVQVVFGFEHAFYTGEGEYEPEQLSVEFYPEYTTRDNSVPSVAMALKGPDDPRPYAAHWVQVTRTNMPLNPNQTPEERLLDTFEGIRTRSQLGLDILTADECHALQTIVDSFDQ